MVDNLSVIITTYNKEEYLRKVLIGFTTQINKNFEVVIADDGSGNKTKDLINWFRENSNLSIKHVWHEDSGFRKCEILNKAIIESTYDYLLFTDDDCVPRADFVDVHLKNAQKGRFLSGGYLKLNKEVTDSVLDENITSQEIFRKKWLLQRGQEKSYKLGKVSRNKIYTLFMNLITFTKPTWNGHNVSGFKSDIISVNGYNEDMFYGGLDRELGERLVNKGVKGKQVRYKAICVHLDHPRPYRNRELLLKNRARRKQVREEKIVWADNGIDKFL